MGFDCASRTHVGLRRKTNEDAVLACPDRGIWAVADGMGGHHAGEIASAMVVDALAAVPPADTVDDVVGQAIAALKATNSALMALANNGEPKSTIGTTVVGLAADRDRYVCFWAGDSRAYRTRDGSITQLTRDHSLVQDLVDAGMLDRCEADNHPNANVITRAVGAAEELRIDVVKGWLQADDIFLLASDGLTRLVSEDELLAELIARPPEAVADRLIALALDRGAPDNVSLVIIRVT